MIVDDPSRTQLEHVNLVLFLIPSAMCMNSAALSSHNDFGTSLRHL